MASEPGTSTDDPTTELGGACRGLESIFCKKHPKNQMILYCEDCTEAMCIACIANHKRHAIINQEEKVGLEKSILESESKIMTKLQLCRDQDDLTKEKVKGRCNTDKVKSQVNSRCDDICKQVNSAREEIITQLREECAEMETRIDTKIEENVVLSHKLESCVGKHQELRKIPEVMRKIQGKRKLEPEVEELTKAKISRIEEHTQWRFIPGMMDARSIKELVGTLRTSNIKSLSGSKSSYEHRSSETAASARNLPQRPVLIKSLSLGKFEIVHNISICEDGDVYLATRTGIKVYSAAGLYTQTIAHNANANARGIAELAGGKLAISCHSNITVKMISKDGYYFHTIALGHVQTQRVALLHNGALAVCYPDEECVRVFKDCGEHAEVVSVIRSFTLETGKQQPTTRPQVERKFEYPWYLTAHGENGLIVSDWGDGAIYALTAGEQGEYTCQWMYGGGTGRGPGMLDEPHGVATDSQGRVLIADCYNHRVLLLSPEGELLRELLTEEDGLNCPTAVAVGAGRLAVSCFGTWKIYKYM